MKKIEAIIKPFKVEGIGVAGMAESEVKGFGRPKGHAEIYRGSKCTVDFFPKVKVELVLPDYLADSAMDTIAKAARTGKIGDGEVSLSPIDNPLPIRTEEAGDSAV